MNDLLYAIRKARRNYEYNNRYKINSYETYKRKEYLLTETEIKFYKVLKEITKELELKICPQVSLYEIIETYNKNEFNKISNKTIDFVITDTNLKIKCCIELDDYTHNEHDRIERDNFLNALFNKINLKLIRIQANNYYDKEKIKNAIMRS